MEFKKLSIEEEYVILKKGTEAPFVGIYDKHYEPGVYRCKQCDTELYKSDSKFSSGCGWPSFDDTIEGRVKEVPDADGRRVEIVCANCDGHLGHVFSGEGFTQKDKRHCVNSISLNFKPLQSIKQKAIFASGCFWGTEHFFKKAKGVISTRVGYIGGKHQNPTYDEVCTGLTGHAEAVEVIFDSTKTSYEEMCILFFETHDFSQLDRQGPDIGNQYRSAIFIQNKEQQEITDKLIRQLKDMGREVATKLEANNEFWQAEKYHQDYYTQINGRPYCHFYKKIFKG